MAKLLVTGGAGFVGSHVCKALAQAGHQPIVYDSLARGHRELVKWGPLEVGDLVDREHLDAAIRRHRPDCVVHMAALAYVAESVADPLGYYANNVGATVSLLAAMRRAGLDTLVYSSSCAIYGVPDRVPIPDDLPPKPINPYGAGKHMVERILRDCEASHGLRAIALRYFNAAGADPDGETGELHDPETHAIPLAILAALGRSERFEVFGTDYPTPDGTAIRDYVHVMDLARAHVAAVDRLLQGAGSAAMNLGTGVGTSVREVIGAVERIAGRPVPVAFRQRRPGDPPILVAEVERARAVLRWEPRYRIVDDIVATAWAWFSRR